MRIEQIEQKEFPDGASDKIGCERSQIATTVGEIRPDTKAYIGPVARTFINPASGQEELLPEYKNIFQSLRNIEHVYTSFPEGKIRRQTDKIGGKTAQQLETELDQEVEFRPKVDVSGFARSMIRSSKFKTSPQPLDLETVRLTVKDLGFNKGTPTTDQIYKRADELGLDLCPAELGPHRRLKDVDQPIGDWYYIAMEQITDSRGRPSVFGLGRDGDGLWLHSGWAAPGEEWSLGSRFVFGLRKPSPQNFSPLDKIFKR